MRETAKSRANTSSATQYSEINSTPINMKETDPLLTTTEPNVELINSNPNVEAKINPATGAVEEKDPKFLKVGDSAIVRITPVRPTCIETFQEFPEMGRFALRDMGATIAAGVVKEITQKV